MAKKGVTVTLVVVGVILAAALAVCVLERMGVIPTPPFLTGAEAAVRIGTWAMPTPAVASTRPNEPLGTISSTRPDAPLETISATSQEEPRVFRPLETISSTAGVVTVRNRPFDGMSATLRPQEPLETIAAGVGGRHLMPLETIGKEMKTSGSAMPPLETIDTGDSNLVYASG